MGIEANKPSRSFNPDCIGPSAWEIVPAHKGKDIWGEPINPSLARRTFETLLEDLVDDLDAAQEAGLDPKKSIEYRRALNLAALYEDEIVALREKRTKQEDSQKSELIQNPPRWSPHYLLH